MGASIPINESCGNIGRMPELLKGVTKAAIIKMVFVRAVNEYYAISYVGPPR